MWTWTSSLKIHSLIPYTYSHVLEPGEEDYDDYTEEDARKYPELEKTDQEVEEERSKMSKEDQEHFDQSKQLMQRLPTDRGDTYPCTSIRCSNGC